jgi:hypothetical protein
MARQVDSQAAIWQHRGQNDRALCEPAISIENTQLTDSENASNSSNATIAKSSVQIAYKDFPELRNF